MAAGLGDGGQLTIGQARISFSNVVRHVVLFLNTEKECERMGQRRRPDRAVASRLTARQAYGLYRIERKIADRSPDERYRVRQELAKPQLDKIREWLDVSLGSVPPQSLTGKALAYLDHQWDRLFRYIDDGRLRIDNNLVENSIRPFVVGRKAWLFSDTVRGAQASANLYSLVETAKANGIEPYAYLRHVFTEIPKATTLEDIEALLPHRIDREQIKRYVDG